ncbi:MAG: heme ABC exporter ATP-binding protein CcmA [Sphingomonadales bacterium]|nr:heme ABC exporter ATP-binding protein CcmA [Sphingomonadales bacterium]MBD3773594.1 heme ABC exporter ATP-binding protein CcmA [Paracoccaceae bacterium]
MQPGPKIAAQELACRRGDRLLFAGLSFELGAGDALHLSGPNGIGKTSLLRILAGLLRPFAGEVLRDGSIGMVDGRAALDPQAPLGQALQFWSALDGCTAPDNHADQLGLGHLLDVPVRYLSTGQLKRAALARLLAQDAAIWLLDEPLNGLDIEGVALVEALVARHCAGGGIALVASHQAITLPTRDVLAIVDFLL